MVHDILVSIVLGWHISGEAGGGALNICPVCHKTLAVCCPGSLHVTSVSIQYTDITIAKHQADAQG